MDRGHNGKALAGCLEKALRFTYALPPVVADEAEAIRVTQVAGTLDLQEFRFSTNLN